MPNTDDFRAELNARIERAGRLGRAHIDVNAGELHRALGGYPSPEHAMPSCCNVMRERFDPAVDEILAEPPSGRGASLSIRYCTQPGIRR